MKCVFSSFHFVFLSSVYTFRTRHRPRQRFNIVPMVTGKMGVEPILPVTISTMLNFDRDWHGDGDGVGTCKQALILVRRQVLVNACMIR